jgi:hypothetical protein
MQKNFSHDTSSLNGEALPAILNDDAFWPVEPKTLGGKWRLRDGTRVAYYCRLFYPLERCLGER